MPQVVGMDIDDAEDAIKDAGLKSSVDEEPAPQPEGIVTAQSVPQGQQRPRGSTIELTVSSGPDDGDGGLVDGNSDEGDTDGG